MVPQLLVAVDGSPDAQQALSHAIDLAESSTPLCGTTMTSDRTEAWRFAHRGLALRPPRPGASPTEGYRHRVAPGGVTAAAVNVGRRDRLGGLVHEYYQDRHDVRVSEPNGTTGDWG
jgi:hypothetical protein